MAGTGKCPSPCRDSRDGLYRTAVRVVLSAGVQRLLAAEAQYRAQSLAPGVQLRLLRRMGLAVSHAALAFDRRRFRRGPGAVRCKSPAVRRIWLWCSLAGNLGMLGLFKYFGFFVDSCAGLLRALGAAVPHRNAEHRPADRDQLLYFSDAELCDRRLSRPDAADAKPAGLCPVRHVFSAPRRGPDRPGSRLPAAVCRAFAAGIGCE